ncbi:peroxiredoxin 1 [Coemansia javaensis]|uniref:Peroxiredoxin 1 n=1 Tax=Coemansia javaensis TaxID=2761396 RepID=A0A9W8LEF5_9FUNG|nr:peroxiredoxin 1 [Coemansia javaensis]
MAPLRLGSVAPDFEAETTAGAIKFHEFIGDSWAVLFSHPADFTPVCTTELGEVAKLAPQFAARNVKVIGLSTNDLTDHAKWVDDINDVNNVTVAFPIIADKDRKVAALYDMLDSAEHDPTNVVNGIPFTVRSVFVIDPAKKIRLILTYPASCGRNFDELLRAVDSLQLSDKQPIATPANWQPGERVIVHVSVPTAKAKEIFPKVDEVLPYLRYAELPAEDAN